LDRLTATPLEPLNLDWLPVKLPKHVWVVISVSSDACSSALASLATMGLTAVPTNVLQLENLEAPSEVASMVDALLAKEEVCQLTGKHTRQLTKQQRSVSWGSLSCYYFVSIIMMSCIERVH
jgi:hypothetical protein